MNAPFDKLRANGGKAYFRNSVFCHCDPPVADDEAISTVAS